MPETQVEPNQSYTRERVYELNLQGNNEEIQQSLKAWKFIGTVAGKPIASVANGIIGIGTDDQTTFNYLDIGELADCSVECELKIINDGGDLSRWWASHLGLRPGGNGGRDVAQ